MVTITSFSGRHCFLSNFYPAQVRLNGEDYPSVEHAYQAAKTTDRKIRRLVAASPTPGAAKRVGRQVSLRPDWPEFRLKVMLHLLRQKFEEPALRAALLATGDAQLIEGNTWGDRFWGVCRGSGENHLGQMLMQIRKEPNPACLNGTCDCPTFDY